MISKIIYSLCLFFTCLIYAGCAKNNQAYNSKLYVDYVGELSPAFQQKVFTAIERINQDAGGELISLNKNEDHQKPLVFANIQSTEVFAHTQTLEYRCFISIDENNSIINSNDPNVIDLRVVLLHEIGHCYNLNHTSNSSDIMAAYFAGTPYMSNSQITLLLSKMQSFATGLLQMEP